MTWRAGTPGVGRTMSSSGWIVTASAPERVCHQLSSKKFQAAYGWAPEVTMCSAIEQIVEREENPIAAE